MEELKSTELRIGNLFLNIVTKNIETIQGINKNKIDSNYYASVIQRERLYPVPIFHLEPIPLTEDILLKCGFERYKTYLFRKRINDDFYLIFSPKDTRPLQCILRMYNDDDGMLQECNNAVDCNFVHQLQNLHFALTGEELEPKL